jgi:hypothetical protein
MPYGRAARSYAGDNSIYPDGFTPVWASTISCGCIQRNDDFEAASSIDRDPWRVLASSATHAADVGADPAGMEARPTITWPSSLLIVRIKTALRTKGAGRAGGRGWHARICRSWWTSDRADPSVRLPARDEKLRPATSIPVCWGCAANDTAESSRRRRTAGHLRRRPRGRLWRIAVPAVRKVLADRFHIGIRTRARRTLNVGEVPGDRLSIVVIARST